MRLQLTVQRHTFPPVKVLYNVGTAQPTSSTAVGSLTISQFVEQVNEVIPLEAEHWGLEDYAVEVKGFECLHYTELSQVLKEDDEVCIRPLQTLDLRQRRISGRHQISADGRHLIDGVAFGRPYPRRIDRPAITIPPRKRRRVTYNQQDDDDVDELSDERQAIVPPGFYNEDDPLGEEDDDDTDGEWLADVDDDDDLQQSEITTELQDIHTDGREMAVRDGSDSLDATTGAEGPGSAETSLQRVTRSQRLSGGLGLQGAALLKLLDENGRPYPGAYNNPLLDFFSQENASTSQEGSQRKRRKTNGLVDTNNVGAPNSGTSSEALANRDRRESSASIKNVRFQNNTLETPPTTILNPNGSEDSEDEDFEPPPDLNNEMDESDKENTEPRVGEVSSDIMSSGSDTSSFVSSESDSDSDDSSSSGSSSSSSSSSGMNVDEPSKASSKLQADSETSSSDLSSSSSSSDSDSEDDDGPTSTKESTVSPPTTTSKDASSKPPNKFKKTQAAELGQRQNSTGQKDLRSIIAATADAALPQPEISGPPQPTVAPGGGYRHTQKRNERRRLAHSLNKGKESGRFADNTTIADIKRMLSENRMLNGKRISIANDYAVTDKDEFESRRKALLESIASGGVEVAAKDTGQAAQGSGSTLVNDTPDEPAAVQTPSMSENSATKRRKGSEQSLLESSGLPLHEESPSLEVAHATISPVNAIQGKSISNERSADDSSPLVQSSKPRAKVDLASSRRMLFGALGLRTPKTKEDEKALQNKLMKDIKPVKQVSTQPETSHQGEVAAAAIDDDESWRDKIDLRAVECCQEGIVLSTPPFPFVQRWDPQQQRGYNGGKGKKGSQNNKKRKRNNQQCYDEEEQRIEPQGKRMKSVSPLTMSIGEMENQQIDSVQPSQDQQDESVINEPAPAGSHIKFADETENYEEDLPPLPEDLAGCVSLIKDSAIAGTVIAFKKLDMSQETNWQPRVSDYKTALINEVSEDGTLRMTLAHRDRPNPAISYDPETGKRTYNKFEMPGYDSHGEEEDEGDSGGLEILFAELIEPKILRRSESYQCNENDHMAIENHDDSRTLQVTEEDHMVISNEGESQTVQCKDDALATDTNQDDVALDAEMGETTIDETVVLDDDDVRTTHEVEDENADESWEGIEDTVAEVTDKEDTADTAQDTEMEDTVAELAQEDASDRVEYPDLSATLKTSGTAEAIAAPTWEPSPSQNDSKRSEQKKNHINEEVREEISKLIRDAGWRSSLNPEVRQEEIMSPAKGSMDEEIHVRSSEPSSPLNGFHSDSHLDGGDDDQELPAEIAETVQEPAVVPDSIEEPRLPSLRQEPSLGIDAADEYPTAIDQDSALWDTQANQQIESEGVSSLSSTPRASKSKVSSHNSRSRTTKSISPPRLSKTKVSPRISSTAPDLKAKGKEGSTSKQVDGSTHNSVSSSDSEFPSLERVFARKIASMTHPTSSNFDTNNDNYDVSEIKSEASDLDIAGLPSHPSTQTSNTQKQHTQKRAPPFRSAPLDESSLQYISDGDTGFVFGSQVPEGSQIIDLTLSSDPVEPSDSAYEGDSSLPTGPGWMQKMRRGERERSAVREGRRGNGGVAMIGR